MGGNTLRGEIFVRTHNGRMPSEGGIRFSYQCDDTLVVLNPYTVYSVSALLAAQKAAELEQRRAAARARGAVILAEVPWATHGRRYCPYCSYSYIYSETVDTDEGKTFLFRCENCHRLCRK